MAGSARSSVTAAVPLAEREGPGASLGRTLRRLRTIRGLSLERLAARCGVSRAMLSQIESGRSMPTITVLGRVAGGLQVTVTELLGDARDAPVVVTRRPEQPWRAVGPLARVRELANDPRLQRVRWLELALDVGAELELPGVAPGDAVNLVVDAGRVSLRQPGQLPVTLEASDASALVAEGPITLSAHRPATVYVLLSKPL
ncbi:MAG: helix-turn-helix domain-containing protein [Myxococcaceae bacterium]|jgi:transcriptional regulator with XRE-family HTH domain|nr:helix-turn-helix domain-containing protein [Myxococcaceae bacterium]